MTYELLNRLRHCGAVAHRSHEADRLMDQLKPLLTPTEYVGLSVARSHHATGEGFEEFYILIKMLLNKYAV